MKCAVFCKVFVCCFEHTSVHSAVLFEMARDPDMYFATEVSDIAHYQIYFEYTCSRARWKRAVNSMFEC